MALRRIRDTWPLIGAGMTRLKVASSRMSAFRAGGEHERAQPFHDGQAEQRAVDDVVDRPVSYTHLTLPTKA